MCLSRLSYLVERLNECRDAYYNKSESLISDKEYDALYDELEMLEETTGVVLANSPTQTVGYEVKQKLEKVKHNHPMLSMAKTKDWTEFINYFGDKDVIGMLKLDGLTCSLRYSNGELVSAETRGNGEIGEDILHNIKTVKSVPITIPYKNDLVVDGEIICTYKDFEKFSDTYKNPRNFASGSIRLLDSKECATRPLTFVAWSIVSGVNEDSFLERLEFADKQGFLVVPWVSSFDWDAKEFLIEQAEENGYPIDGLVGRFDSISYGDSLGSTSHHPKHSMAFKFYQEENETTLLNIEWSTSRTGLVNPVAVFEPVEIDDTTVTRASLSNVSIVEELELGIGDTITVIKANQIIPKVTKNLTRSNTCTIPTECPSCGSELRIRDDNGRKVLVCSNKNCGEQAHDRLVNYVSKKAMDIEGLSEERIKVLADNNLISDFTSLYSLEAKRQQIVNINGMGELVADTIINGIQKTRNRKLSNVLVALGIPCVGTSTAKDISKHCYSLFYADGKNMLAVFLDKCAEGYRWDVIDGIGEATANNINKYVLENFDSFASLSYYLLPSKEIDEAENKLSGKTFCITGKLNVYKNRDALVEDIEKNGGISVSSVTAKTDYLINNDIESNSSKNQKAKKFGTTIITEAQFIDFILN